MRDELSPDVRRLGRDPALAWLGIASLAAFAVFCWLTS